MQKINRIKTPFLIHLYEKILEFKESKKHPLYKQRNKFHKDVVYLHKFTPKRRFT
jgi:hypothetical protein